MERDHQTPENFPIPLAYPHGRSTKEIVSFHADQAGIETKYLHDGPEIEIILPADYWANLPDENKREAMRLLAEIVPDYLERRRQSK